MLAETASEGDDVTRYFDSLGLKDTIALITTVLSIGYRAMDFTPLIHTDETLLSGLHGFGNISWIILTHHQHAVPPSWQSDHSLILLDLTIFSQISVSVSVPVSVPVPAFRVFHLPSYFHSQYCHMQLIIVVVCVNTLHNTTRYSANP